MPGKWIKIGGIALSILGTAVGMASDYVGRKSIINELAKSKELKELLAKEVAEQILKNNKGAL